MKNILTDEQTAVIRSTGNIRINAVAGSGKTTTLVEYAATRPAGSRILYLAFNRSVKLEAARKFEERGLPQVKVETAHSLAFKYIVPRHGYKIRTQGYRTHEIAELLKLQGNGEKHAEFIIANHINKFVTWFCNSDRQKVQELNYLDIVTDPKAATFVRSFYAQIEEGTRLLLAWMDRGEIECTHDFYLKKFQLSAQQLPYDYILFDEAQDASGVMLDLLKKQQATKVIVGDIHQQIYGWRHAVNSLEQTDFQLYQLTTSFRFPADIARLATEILEWKKQLGTYSEVTVRGLGTSVREVSKATIARTNLGLLLKAIEYITDNRKVRHIYFEGNINSYTYADDGASLYDVLDLSNNKKDRIRDKLIRSMKDLDELEEYIEKTEDMQLSMMAGIVKEYGSEVHDLIRSLKDLHTGDEEKDKAEMVFSTVHRAKGMEYDVVNIVDDFISEEKLEKWRSAEKNKDIPLNTGKLNEEINLLYVAITRAKYKLCIPDTLIPENFPAGRHIVTVKKKSNGAHSPGFVPADPLQHLKRVPESRKAAAAKPKAGTNTVLEKRRLHKLHKDAYQPWAPELDQELLKMADAEASIGAMAEHFGRTKGAVISRLKKLGYYN